MGSAWSRCAPDAAPCGAGAALRSKSPDMVRQEIYGYLLTHDAIAALICRAANKADIDPDRVKFLRTVRIIRHRATDPAFPPDQTRAIPRCENGRHHQPAQPQALPPPPKLSPGDQTRPPQLLPGQTPTKGGRSRTVSIDSETIAILREHHRQQAVERLAAGSAWNDNGGLVFTNRWGEPLYPDTVTALMSKLISGYNRSVAPPATPLTHARLHDLRHRHAATLLLAGVPVHDVAARLGHPGPGAVG
jgi:hypothetical protein